MSAITWQRPQSPQYTRFCAVTRYEGGASIAACGGRWATSSTYVLIGVDVGKLECPACRDALDEVPIAKAWTGPDDRDLAPDGSLRWSVPSERWPFGPPSFHEDICNLRPQPGRPGGLYCDCKASDAGDRTHGETSHTAPIERDATTNRYRRSRENAGLTLGQAARILGLPVARLSAMETSGAVDTGDPVAFMADRYGVSVEWLTGRAPFLDRKAVTAMKGSEHLSFHDSDTLAELLASRPRVEVGLAELRNAPAIVTAELHTAPRDGVLFEAFDTSDAERGE